MLMQRDAIATAFTVCCLMLLLSDIRAVYTQLLQLLPGKLPVNCCLLFIIVLAVSDAVITIVTIILFC